MPKEQFVDMRLRKDTLTVIEVANEIINEYRDRLGLTLTVRQLYYQFVARGFIDNNLKEYKKLQATISNGRLAGLIDWEAIEDRTRNLRAYAKYATPKSLIASSAARYAIDLWKTQDTYVEVWVEKEALVGVIERPCSEYRVPFFACRGYTSQSEQWRAGRRFLEADSKGKRSVVIHLGDHDPSGLDMTRDNSDRLNLFACPGQVEIRRIALNMDQVEHYNPPHNPAKETDTRANNYIAEYGQYSWELDALDPSVIYELIINEIKSLIDMSAFNAALEKERRERQHLYDIADNYDVIAKFLKEYLAEE